MCVSVGQATLVADGCQQASKVVGTARNMQKKLALLRLAWAERESVGPLVQAVESNAFREDEHQHRGGELPTRQRKTALCLV